MKCRVLIIEDDHALADVLKMKLKREDHNVTVAQHQREAYRLLDKSTYDFVLLDLRLPVDKNDMDPNIEVGFSILNHIRDSFSQDDLPVIVMTAYEETSQTAVRALKAYANDYIQKPFEDSIISFDDKLNSLITHIEQVKRMRLEEKDPTLSKPFKIVFKQNCVEISGIKIDGRGHELLLLLGRYWFSRQSGTTGRRNPAVTGKEIANALNIEEATVRKYVSRFRGRIADEFEKLEMGKINKQDIIRNRRDWEGYELNYDKCYISRE